MQRKRSMSRSRAGIGRRMRGARLAAFISLGVLVTGCSSDSSSGSEDTRSESVQPYSGAGEGPGATETNFLTLPCDKDADCAAGRCIQPDSGPRRCE
jgi:hypothetical protein